MHGSGQKASERKRLAKQKREAAGTVSRASRRAEISTAGV
ncbi:hypothetical protein PAMC26510_32980 [Caballeronia sordidicola]|uniref:Uncharacterized protein n=1 Tax=Caballeronia sordidicola TaxID=196367 RepID=A0A242M628_CABSO|nr:hypothetical protein PAMC26510_32980 [Caballeronia sordidicola]